MLINNDNIEVNHGEVEAKISSKHGEHSLTKHNEEI